MQASAVGVSEVQNDLERKGMSLMQSHYGNVRYIPSYAAAGHTMTFHMHVITTDGAIGYYSSYSSAQLCLPTVFVAVCRSSFSAGVCKAFMAFIWCMLYALAAAEGCSAGQMRH